MSPVMTIESVREDQRRYELNIESLLKYDENTLPPKVKAPFVKNRVTIIKCLKKEIRILDKIVSLIEAGEIVMTL